MSIHEIFIWFFFYAIVLWQWNSGHRVPLAKSKQKRDVVPADKGNVETETNRIGNAEIPDPIFSLTLENDAV